MISFALFFVALVFTVVHVLIRRVDDRRAFVIAFDYLLFFNVGMMGLLAFYAHLFRADATAENIGWAPGSPFQSEIGMANLSYGVLGLLSFWMGRKFALATVIGFSILLLGAFVVHIMQYLKGDIAPWNIGVFVWFNDLFLPMILLPLAIYVQTIKSRPF